MRQAIVALALVVFLTAAARGRDGEPAIGDERASAVARGARLFAADFSPQQGLGPLFNHTSCLGCHRTPSPGGTGPGGLGTVTRVGERHRERPRSRAGASSPGRRWTGTDRPVRVEGRHRHAAAVLAEAFRNELGITSPLAPVDLSRGAAGRRRCAGDHGGLEDDGSLIDAVTAFLAALPPPAPIASERGLALFTSAGCAACHIPGLPVGRAVVSLYSDLLLHDLGPDLDDKVVQGQAGGRDWRTTPLWGLSRRSRLLHDGRARSIGEAIRAHGAASVQRFHGLSPADRDELLAFLAGL